MKLDENELEQLLRDLFPTSDQIPQVESITTKEVFLRLPIKDHHLRPGGSVSGPTQMALADTAAYVLILSRLGPVVQAVTTSLQMDFLKRPTPHDLIAHGEVLKFGKRLVVSRVTLFSSGTPEPVSHATVTYSIPKK